MHGSHRTVVGDDNFLIYFLHCCYIYGVGVDGCWGKDRWLGGGGGGGRGGRLTSWPTRTTVLDIFQDPTGRVYIYNRLKIK